MNADENERVRRIVDSSGFPLQIGIANFIARDSEHHHFHVLHSEHSWRGADGQGGFIDLVIEHPTLRYLFVIECKRLLEGSWIFLVPNSKTAARRHAKVGLTQFDPASKTYRLFNWQNCPLEPTTPEAAYCVVKDQDERRPILERLGSECIAATEAFAQEDAVRVEAARIEMPYAYASVIVTTADLTVARFDAGSISLTDGKIPELKTESVPFLRFRKQLSISHSGFKSDEIRDKGARAISYAKERTVFVVQATALLDFVCSFEIDDWIERDAR
jgi:hypothetical protein